MCLGLLKKERGHCDDAQRAAERSYPTSKVRGDSREELTCLRPGAVARRSNSTSKERWLHPRSGGCTGARGPRGAIPRSRSGGAVVRRYSLSKVKSSGCTLLE